MHITIMDNSTQSSSAREETSDPISTARAEAPANDSSLKPDRPSAEKRSLLAEKFLASVDRKSKMAQRQEPAEENHEDKELYFFYGSLMHPRMLRHVLELSELPEVKPAEIVGYRTKVWGPYPALVAGKAEEVFKGVVYEVQSGDHKDRLQRYETDCYRIAKCSIRVDGAEEEVLGKTFIWNGDEEDLDDGAFDNEAWMARMDRIIKR
ncbi:hypothetical protein VM1G_05534 [Cytospora mali]|uniref:Putative gamma-glutamylcyclotransferase n=1 Tax=Cytospora mali TaxID=578113 RepID=A0A194VYZ0_CYTMA|nr:hypothetical protein VM1G_05534 [Valsa mali]